MGTGLTLIFIAACAGGLFALPLRLRRTFEVENMWGAAFLLGYGLIPQLAAMIWMPEWYGFWSSNRSAIPAVFGFGFGWGVASLLFALAVNRMGLSLGFSLIMGVNAAVGTLAPLVLRGESMRSDAVLLLAVGLATVLAGCFLTGRAGYLRDLAGLGRRELMIGIGLCLPAGILSACANIGYNLAPESAAGIGTMELSLIRWLPLYWGGCLAMAVFTAVGIGRKRAWGRFTAVGNARDWLLTLAAAVLLALTQWPYGVGASFLGRFGTVGGWTIYIVFSMLFANGAGILRGEWRHASVKSRIHLYAGLALLTAGSGLAAWSNR